MKSALKARWVNALRSGEYKQGSSMLRTKDNAYCCLGVLCEVKTGRKPKIGQRYYGTKLIGFYFVKKLAQMNDGFAPYTKHTFKKLATYIEKNL